MKLDIVAIDYKIGHLDCIPGAARQLGKSKDHIAKSIESLVTAGNPIKTLLYAEMAIAIVGIFRVNDGTGEAIAIVSPDVKNYVFQFHRACIKILEDLTKSMKLNRVQCTVKKDFMKGLKWARALGFETEGLLKKYGPEGSDYFMLSRLS
jgi:hypothetical protein